MRTKKLEHNLPNSNTISGKSERIRLVIEKLHFCFLLKNLSKNQIRDISPIRH